MWAITCSSGWARSGAKRASRERERTTSPRDRRGRGVRRAWLRAASWREHEDVRVTLLDRNNYHQFQPLLYQVATSQLIRDEYRLLDTRALPQPPECRREAGRGRVDRPGDVYRHRDRRRTWSGDAVVLAAGSQPNFFGTPGADRNSFPLYSLRDAQQLRSRIIAVFEHADRDPRLIERGALNFVVVGGGPTGVETAGALADMINQTMAVEYRDIAVTKAEVHVVDLGHTLLAAFSERAHDYVAKVLGRKGVKLHLDTKVTEIAPGHVTLADGTTIATRCVIWGGGIKAPSVASTTGLAAGSRRAHRRPARLDGRGLPALLRGGRRRQHQGR